MIPTRYSRGQILVPTVASLLFLGACEDDPTGVDPDPIEQISLDEIYEVDRENDVQYGAALDEGGVEEALRLDLYLPRDDGEGLRPAVIWLHGGGYQMGHKGEMTEFARRTARRGYVTASANYRLREAEVFDYTNPADSIGEQAKLDAQHDVLAAVRWLKARAGDYGIDPERIYLVGYSAGGTAALRGAARPDDPGSSGNPEQSSNVAGVVAISGYLDEGVLEAAGPTLLIHGEADTKVPLARMVEACDAVATCSLATVPGAAHNMISLEMEQIITETASFLYDRASGP